MSLVVTEVRLLCSLLREQNFEDNVMIKSCYESQLGQTGWLSPVNKGSASPTLGQASVNPFWATPWERT